MYEKYSLYFPSLVQERGKEEHNVTPPIYIVAGGKAGPTFGPLVGNILLLDFISIWQYFIWSGVKIQVNIKMDYDGINYNNFNTIQFMDWTRGKCCPYKILSLIFFAHFVDQTKRQLFFSSFENFSTIIQRKGKLSMTDEGK